MLRSRGQLRILDFDVECRPLAWYAGDFNTKQPTAIACKFINLPGAVVVRAIGESDRNSKVLDEEKWMLEWFLGLYAKADIVTGHFVRGFDLPTLNAALDRLAMPTLGSKYTQDTKLDYIKASGISKSMENLGAMYELEHPKVPMNTGSWGKANMLLPEGIRATKKRVVGDVLEHIELREQMLERGVLGPMKRWSPGGGAPADYHP